ncbi:F-BOX DOMAIN CONTAINING PROTEIN EXPRESSED [Salix purpurea]|uniref:F-BOX DOMAIN CONTAINING PROTEIN EXPRESSED n=1 Tax=Salix purpurea TaxID=77065 RepID=A0A9Q0VXZ9_SALPP|nr:F-BOX DOMAIN CONTAINING PROTEIN EXPRESSED [Salix purpurea]KAJ6756648.1 F-BOX DOMAIN CONTAINING PROTEIN EXPRESSED [Salix purpurea]
MEERKWEDLEFDCLVNVLGRVGMESLLLDVPFVCRSWHEASRSPSCWKHLVFPQDIYLTWDVTLLDKFEDYYEIHNCSEDAFIKFVVGRSHGNCTGLSLPNDCSEEVLKYIADKCPALISLSLPADHFLSSESLSILPTLIGKWEHLENLWLGSSDYLVNIITEITLACSKFSGLSVSSATIREEEASAIVTNLPNIKSLILRGARMDLKSLVIILQGCKNLVHLDVRDCRGFISDDERVLELASNIKTFMCEGSMLDDDEDDDHHCFVNEY